MKSVRVGSLGDRLRGAGTLRLRAEPESFRWFWRSYGPSNRGIALLLGRILSIQRRSRGVSTADWWLCTGLGVGNWWCSEPISIPWASGVHVDGMAICWGGGGLKVFGAVRDNGAGFLIQAFPAVFFLAGDEEDLLGGAGFAEPGGVEVGDVARPPMGGGRRPR